MNEDESIESYRSRLTEWLLEDEELADKEFSLRNGGRVKAKIGLFAINSLRDLLGKAPHHFQTLLAIANGKNDGLDQVSIKFLRHCGYIQKNGKMKQEIQDVLLSAYQETAEGVVLANPFRLESADDGRALEKLDEAGALKLLEWIRRGQNDGPTP